MTFVPTPDFLSGKTALVTGASRGIGRAIAQRLSEAGVHVAVHYNARQIEQLALAALGYFDGRVDILVHNAGVYVSTPLLSTATLSKWRAGIGRQMQINFTAGADLAYLLAGPMARAGWGRILQISSRAGIRGEAGHAGYGAGKAAQINLIRSLAVELAPHGIGCFGVAPGWTDTEMAANALAQNGDEIRASIPMGRVATPDDVAQLVGYLVTPAADYLSGSTIDVNGASYLH